MNNSIGRMVAFTVSYIVPVIPVVMLNSILVHLNVGMSPDVLGPVLAPTDLLGQ